MTTTHSNMVGTKIELFQLCDDICRGVPADIRMVDMCFALTSQSSGQPELATEMTLRYVTIFDLQAKKSQLRLHHQAITWEARPDEYSSLKYSRAKNISRSFLHRSLHTQ